MTNPYVFIVGCPRSGTTLLQRMVNAHPQIAITPESHWIPRLRKKGLTAERLVTPELISLLQVQRRFGELHIDESKLEELLASHQPASYADFIAAIFDEYGKAQGKALVGNKTPGFVRKLGTLHTLWPKARFVHLIRDGRDVYLSHMHRPLKNPNPEHFRTWEEGPATTAALFWELNVREGQRAGKSLGPELYYEMRYESLVNNPQKECAALCGFLGLPYDDAMLRFYESETKPRAARPITTGLRDWRSQMTVEDVERFEASAGEFLDELGYSRAAPGPGPEALKHAARIRDIWAQNRRARDELEVK